MKQVTLFEGQRLQMTEAVRLTTDSLSLYGAAGPAKASDPLPHEAAGMPRASGALSGK